MLLTNDEKLENKQKYLGLLKVINTKDLTPFINYLEAIDYFNKPATAVSFNAFEGGLCKYALDLYCELYSMCNAYVPNKYTDEDLLKVALFRDLYRAEMYESFMRNVKNDQTGVWEAVKAFRIKEDRPTFGEIGFSSYMIAKHFFEFTDEQIEAICHSSIRDTASGELRDINDVRRSYPLVTLLCMADLAVSYLIPVKGEE